MSQPHHNLAAVPESDEPVQAMERLRRIADRLGPEGWQPLLDTLTVDLLNASFKEAGADEGTLWVPDEDVLHLVPVYNSGPHTGRVVGKFRQPLDAGLICMVFATEQPFVENDVQANARQSKLLDLALGVRTGALIAVPLHFFSACRGVISCVQLEGAADGARAKAGFAASDLARIERVSALTSRLVEWKLMTGEVHRV